MVRDGVRCTVRVAVRDGVRCTVRVADWQLLCLCYFQVPHGISQACRYGPGLGLCMHASMGLGAWPGTMHACQYGPGLGPCMHAGMGLAWDASMGLAK